MELQVSILIAAIGCIVGVGGWLSNRDSKMSQANQWRGRVDTKLDTIYSSIQLIAVKLETLQKTVIEHGERLVMNETNILDIRQRVVDLEKKVQTHVEKS